MTETPQNEAAMANAIHIRCQPQPLLITQKLPADR